MLRLGRDNLFDYVRLYAALQVALKHAYNYIDFPSAGLLAHIFTLSGVPVFFSLSGFLIGLSFLRSFRDRDFVKFFYRRIYRI